MTDRRTKEAPARAPPESPWAYKLIEAAQSPWRAVNAPQLVALVRAGAHFENGKLVERPDESGTTEAA